jgi:hypothetical protein
VSASCPQAEPIDREARRFCRPPRTREAQQAKQFRAELVAHAGGRPSTVQLALIEQCVQLKLRLAVMDRAFAETGSMSAHDSKVYLAWSNSLSRMLKQIGVKAVTTPALTLAEHLARRAQQASAASSERAANTPNRLSDV